jgi:hypothetical protein
MIRVLFKAFSLFYRTFYSSQMQFDHLGSLLAFLGSLLLFFHALVFVILGSFMPICPTH